MKMETNHPVTGNLNSTVANTQIASAHFPAFGDDITLDYFENLENLDQNEFRKLFSHPEFPLCRNSSYQHLPICQGNISMGEPYDHSEEVFQYAFIVELVVPIIFGIVVIVGVFGNALVVLVIIINKQMRSTTNYLIFSLAIADLLFTLFCVPFTASDYIFSKWPFGSVWCKVVQYLTYVTAYASVYTLLLLSIDRYLAVVHPIYAISIRTEKNAIYAIVCTWTLILASCVPLYIVHGLSEIENCKFNEDQYHHAAFHIGFITTMYFIPLTVIVGLYLMILQRLWSQSAPGGTRSAESVRGKKRVTRMVVIVIVTFIICWLPIQIVLLLKSLGMYEMTTSRIFIQIFGQALAYMNSCVNPILYAFLSDPFRKAFRKVMSCGPQRKSSQNCRLTYEGTTQTRQVTQRQQSIALATFPDSLSPPALRGNNNSTGSERKLIEPGDHHFSKSCMNTTTTSFGNGSTKGDDSPTPSCQSNLNGIV